MVIMLKRKMLRDIRKNLSQFITIFLMVMIGIMAYSGIKSYMDGMSKTADKFYSENNLFDLNVVGNLNHDDLKNIKSIDNVKDAELKLSVTAITDNDKKPSLTGSNIEDNFAIFRGTTIDDWTLEAAFYNCNNSYFDEQYEDRKTEAKYNGEECPKALAHMLKNKTENAIFMATNIENIEIPNYIQEAIKWINE